MKEQIFHSLRSRLVVIQAQRLVVIQCAFRSAAARRLCRRRLLAICYLQSRCRSSSARSAAHRKIVTMFLNDAVVACDEALIVRYLDMAHSEQDGVVAAKRKLVRISETREFITGLKQFAPISFN